VRDVSRRTRDRRRKMEGKRTVLEAAWDVMQRAIDRGRKVKRFDNVDPHEGQNRQCPACSHWLNGEEVGRCTAAVAVVCSHERRAMRAGEWSLAKLIVNRSTLLS